MKKQYFAPSAEIVEFETSDIITVSFYTGAYTAGSDEKVPTVNLDDLNFQ